jgi:hypothetical protein
MSLRIDAVRNLSELNHDHHPPALDISSPDLDMLPAMSRKLLATALIFAWIVFSGVDLLEDLRFTSADGSYRHSSAANSLPAQGRHYPDLANNIIELAAPVQTFSSFGAGALRSPESVEPLASFQQVFDLHKLHRVFLI